MEELSISTVAIHSLKDIIRKNTTEILPLLLLNNLKLKNTQKNNKHIAQKWQQSDAQAEKLRLQRSKETNEPSDE